MYRFRKQLLTGLLSFLLIFSLIGCGDDDDDDNDSLPEVSTAAYIVNGGAQTLSVFNIETSEVTNDVLNVGNIPSDIKIRGDKAYVVNYGDNSVQIIDLENRSGVYITPSLDAFRATAAAADWSRAPGFYMVLTDKEGESIWPIFGASFILMHKEQNDAEKVKSMLEFFHWCYRYGRSVAENLHYIAMPESVVRMIETLWRDQIRVDGKNVWNEGSIVPDGL